MLTDAEKTKLQIQQAVIGFTLAGRAGRHGNALAG